ncbi:hypothetical protein Patl1_01673 [Pistacia atlantica]|uniref:Uncharacterized protein n=1 Tax=Pistacia atlantica TaxID=434234 RepID=A0ACC1CBT2_9ROSI|nr:hypothetical protein Patl1_01673 [Pistacia atlantica]
MRLLFPKSRRSRTRVVKPLLGPYLAPAPSPIHQAFVAGPRIHPIPRHRHGGHHHHAKPRVVTPSPSEGQGCDQICVEPFTAAPYGSPCGCVFPMKVKLLLDVAPYAVFPVMNELEIEVAAGTYLQQSQVKIMGASADSQNQGKTVVEMNLVPLGDKFDNTTANLTYERLVHKKVPLNTTLFGLPSSPPYGSYMGSGPSGSVGGLPITANFVNKSQRMNLRTICIIALSAFVVLLVFIGAIAILVKWRKARRPSNAVGPAFTSSINKRSGIGSILSSSMASSTSVSLMSTMATCILSVKTFSLSELDKATEKFSSKRILGEGGFGRVYRGTMEDGMEVADAHAAWFMNLFIMAVLSLTYMLVDPSLAGSYDFDDMAKVAAIASMCVHPEPKGVFCSRILTLKVSLHHQIAVGGMPGALTPRLRYGQASSFITMEYSSGPLEDVENRAFSASSLGGDGVSLPIRHGNRSGPLRTVRSLDSLVYEVGGQASNLRIEDLNGGWKLEPWSTVVIVPGSRNLQRSSCGCRWVSGWLWWSLEVKMESGEWSGGGEGNEK